MPGAQVPKYVHPASKMCTPGAGCTVTPCQHSRIGAQVRENNVFSLQFSLHISITCRCRCLDIVVPSKPIWRHIIGFGDFDGDRKKRAW